MRYGHAMARTKVTRGGQISLPAAIRRRWGVAELEIEDLGDRIVLRPAAADPVGLVSSGTYAPSLEQGAGMAYVRADLAAPGTALAIDVRGKHRAARVASKPLYSAKRS